MKDNQKSKFLLTIIILLSVFSTVFLEMQDERTNQLTSESDFAEAYISDSSFLPDVKIVKEVLKSIFNVVRS